MEVIKMAWYLLFTTVLVCSEDLALRPLTMKSFFVEHISNKARLQITDSNLGMLDQHQLALAIQYIYDNDTISTPQERTLAIRDLLNTMYPSTMNNVVANKRPFAAVIQQKYYLDFYCNSQHVTAFGW